MIDKRHIKIIFILPLPPPVHGSSVMCEKIRQSLLINESMRCRYVNLSTSRGSDEVGSFSSPLVAQKAGRFLGAWVRTLWLLLTHRPDVCYLAITCHGVGFLKDAPFVLLCKLFCRKIIIHQHNKGMASYANRFFYRFLLRWVYRYTTVILLSWRLYDDVSDIVHKDQIRICPNGI